MSTDKIVIQWREPTEQIIKRVRSYISNSQDYPDGFGMNNPRHIANHAKLHKQLGLKSIPWLRQVHSSVLCSAPSIAGMPLFSKTADASWSDRPYVACAVLTADCLPVFFANAEATQVAVAHAGWRGLAAGVLESTLASFPQGDKIFAAFGPAISQKNYEVGGELTDTFSDYGESFEATNNGKFLLSLYKLASAILEKQGVSPPIIPKWCTFSSSENGSGESNNSSKLLFPSYRRDKHKAAWAGNARTANLIWIE